MPTRNVPAPLSLALACAAGGAFALALLRFRQSHGALSSSTSTSSSTAASAASSASSSARSATADPPPSALIPLVSIDIDFADAAQVRDASRAVVGALSRSGFLLVRTARMTTDLQQEALSCIDAVLSPATAAATGAAQHPVDPKRSLMLAAGAQIDALDAVRPGAGKILSAYMAALEDVKEDLLRLIARGLGLLPESFVRLHSERNSSLRLLQYMPVPLSTGNRCKEHSDYGTVTLLSTDGNAGLEAFDNWSGTWLPVPHVPGTLVVNLGSLMHEWTDGALLATLHRVAGPATVGTVTPGEVLRAAAGEVRHSIAFFADPDATLDLSLSAAEEAEMERQGHGGGAGEGGSGGGSGGGGGGGSGSGSGGGGRQRTVAEYIRWRSGKEGEGGVALMVNEEARVKVAGSAS